MEKWYLARQNCSVSQARLEVAEFSDFARFLLQGNGCRRSQDEAGAVLTHLVDDPLILTAMLRDMHHLL